MECRAEPAGAGVGAAGFMPHTRRGVECVGRLHDLSAPAEGGTRHHLPLSRSVRWMSAHRTVPLQDGHELSAPASRHVVTAPTVRPRPAPVLRCQRPARPGVPPARPWRTLRPAWCRLSLGASPVPLILNVPFRPAFVESCLNGKSHDPHSVMGFMA